MMSPGFTVTESPLGLEPVIPDPFADGLERERASEALTTLLRSATDEPRDAGRRPEWHAALGDSGADRSHAP
jgi:hypothetical protein